MSPRPLLLLSVLLGGLLALKALSLADGAISWMSGAAHAVEDNEPAPAARESAPPPLPASRSVEEEPAIVLPSQSELDLQNRVAQRLRALDQREAELDTREQLIEVAERRMDEREARLIELRDDIHALVGELDSQREAQLNALVRVYATMEPEAAAPVMQTLMETDRETLLKIAAQMQESNARRFSQIMESANPRFVAELTMMLAARAQPPQTRAELEARRVAAAD
ncbi:hypothetical protein F1654_05905 [Alkalicaulis satelles]|uniref:Magnesium transporter MgtE intracellular domain-containing protein n=1 Tax=Alkalicaulis satelles TaxID=2609175 RepID=A0A5M6ZF04_9PROT|nr:hypothetical protein [Alkalicaulis satelles]KAA5803342.1 hypothetical protein F1654_05905 [Alkalicaulis satelles]